jgi:hypothetical protein
MVGYLFMASRVLNVNTPDAAKDLDASAVWKIFQKDTVITLLTYLPVGIYIFPS